MLLDSAVFGVSGLGCFQTLQLLGFLGHRLLSDLAVFSLFRFWSRLLSDHAASGFLGHRLLSDLAVFLGFGLGCFQTMQLLGFWVIDCFQTLQFFVLVSAAFRPCSF